MSFALDMQKFTKKANANIDVAVKRIVSDVAYEVIMMSPVGDATKWDVAFKEAAVKLGWIPEKGYIGGRFRGNWGYGFNVTPSGTYDTIDKTGETSKARIATGLSMSGTAGIHYISNNLPYGPRLEEGYSKQAPNGMVSLTVLKWQSIVDDAAKGLA